MSQRSKGNIHIKKILCEKYKIICKKDIYLVLCCIFNLRMKRTSLNEISTSLKQHSY